MNNYQPPADCVSSPLTKGGERGNILQLTLPYQGARIGYIDCDQLPPYEEGKRGDIIHFPLISPPHFSPSDKIPRPPDKIPYPS